MARFRIALKRVARGRRRHACRLHLGLFNANSGWPAIPRIAGRYMRCRPDPAMADTSDHRNRRLSGSAYSGVFHGRAWVGITHQNRRYSASIRYRMEHRPKAWAKTLWHVRAEFPAYRKGLSRVEG